MSKAILKFDLDNPDDLASFKRASSSGEAYRALWEISQQVFRPHRKHGYSNQKLQALLEHEDPKVAENVYEAISLLEAEFWAILGSVNIDLDDY